MAFNDNQPRDNHGRWAANDNSPGIGSKNYNAIMGAVTQFAAGRADGPALVKQFESGLNRDPVGPHAGQKSVGTHKSRKTKLTSAAHERVALMKRGDAKVYDGPSRSR